MGNRFEDEWIYSFVLGRKKRVLSLVPHCHILPGSVNFYSILSSKNLLPSTYSFDVLNQ